MGTLAGRAWLQAGTGDAPNDSTTSCTPVTPNLENTHSQDFGMCMHHFLITSALANVQESLCPAASVNTDEATNGHERQELPSFLATS